ncbi:MAG: DUF1127 domain-containing protein [Alphaproteobacteria bacterium]
MTMITSILSRPAFRLSRVSLPLGKWIRVSSERRSLAGLNEHQLRDIGVDAVAAATEASRPFWDVPKGH